MQRSLLFINNSLAGIGDVFTDGFEDFMPITNSTNVFLSGHSLLDDPLADYLASISTDKGIAYQWNEQHIVGSPIRYRNSGTVSPPNNWQGYTTKTMSQCRNLFATQICSSYYNFDGRPGEVAGCEDWMNTNTNNYYNPFNWSDAGLIVWPDS